MKFKELEYVSWLRPDAEASGVTSEQNIKLDEWEILERKPIPKETYGIEYIKTPYPMLPFVFGEPDTKLKERMRKLHIYDKAFEREGLDGYRVDLYQNQ